LGRARHRDGPRRLLGQDALHGLSELAKTHSVDIAPADALITYFEQHCVRAGGPGHAPLAARYFQASGTRAVVPLVTRAGWWVCCSLAGRIVSCSSSRS